MVSPVHTEEMVLDTADRQQGRLCPAGGLTVVASPRTLDERSALAEVGAWASHYLRSHPLMSLNNVGGQMVLGVRAVQYLLYMPDAPIVRENPSPRNRFVWSMDGGTVTIQVPLSALAGSLRPEYGGT